MAMMHHLIALVNLIGLFFVEVFLLADIRVSQDIPAIIQAGSEVKVTVSIEKGSLTGFAKLQIDLPAGLSATSIETKGASFTFADGKAKFIWMALPASPKFQVSYTLTADASASGTLPINGKLSYIEDNERKTFDLATSTIQVSGGAAAQVPVQEPVATERATTADQQPVVTPPASWANDVVSAAGAAPAPADAAPATTRSTPGALRIVAAVQGQGGVSGTRVITPVTETEYLVEVTVNKGDIRGFGKLQETIPAGFTALEKTSDEAIFTAQGTIAKFVWLNLPARSTLKVVYKLRSTPESSGDYVVNGEFGYLLNDETQKAVLGSTKFTIGSQAVAQQVEQPKVEQPKVEPPVVKTEVPKAEQKTEPVQQATAQQSTKPKTTNKIPAPETGVVYKVQITAAHREVGSPYFAERHRYSGDFGIERHEGWIKYTTGRFGQYKEARDQRVSFISAGHNFPGPFVTAYNNGDRITVQEALMIGAQKWVQ